MNNLLGALQYQPPSLTLRYLIGSHQNFFFHITITIPPVICIVTLTTTLSLLVLQAGNGVDFLARISLDMT